MALELADGRFQIERYRFSVKRPYRTVSPHLRPELPLGLLRVGTLFGGDICEGFGMRKRQHEDIEVRRDDAEPTGQESVGGNEETKPAASRLLQFLGTPRASSFMQANLSSGTPGIFAGYALIGAVIGFGSLGYLLDAQMGTTPLFIVVGMVIGICLGFYNLVTTTQRR